MSEKRKYRMRQRAKSQEETRRRIVEATMQLHEEIGPRATTMSAIAERAGVQRLTVYRHFPDETAVFQACTSHWLEINPPPDPVAWNSSDDPERRFRTAAAAYYDYYGRTRRMWTAAIRDAPDVPALHEPMSEVAEAMRQVTDDLIRPFGTGNNNIGPTIRHVFQFPTWSDLEEQGLTDARKVELVTSWLGLN